MRRELKEFVNMYHIRMRKGKLVLYKAVTKEYGSLYLVDINDGNLVHGCANVYLPGTEVKVEPNDVNTNPVVLCGKGLHVGTWRCAKLFASQTSFSSLSKGPRIMEVLVDPKDVICVPNQSIEKDTIGGITIFPKESAQKIRCKRLIVVKEIEKGENI